MRTWRHAAITAPQANAVDWNPPTITASQHHGAGVLGSHSTQWAVSLATGAAILLGIHQVTHQ